jgi:hypothetical protein
MWPTDTGAPNDLRAGDVVADRDRPGELKVVSCDPGGVGWGPGGRLDRDVSMVRLDDDGRPSPGSATITDNHHRRWVRVPEDDLCAVARVTSAHYGWRPLSGRSEADVAESGPADDDHEPWHLLAALLPSEAFDRVTLGFDWPGCFELALEASPSPSGPSSWPPTPPAG